MRYGDYEVCKSCVEDMNVICKRDADVQCRHCLGYFCGGHIAEHLQKVHCVAIDNKHCTKEEVSEDDSSH